VALVPPAVWGYAAYNGTYRDLKKRVNLFVRAGGRFVIVGDSISRQFAKTLECTLAHKLGLGDDAERAVVFCPSHGLQLERTRRCIDAARVEDVIVINFGLHVHPQKDSSFRTMSPDGRRCTWQVFFEEMLQHYLALIKAKTASGSIDASRVFYRTTPPRFVSRGGADWDSGKMACGATAPRPEATFDDYGGHYKAQPLQNHLLLSGLDHSSVQLFDVTPVTLSRSDTAFDCSHLCLPGVMDTWASMLLNRALLLPSLSTPSLLDPSLWERQEPAFDDGLALGKEMFSVVVGPKQGSHATLKAVTAGPGVAPR
jgi:hypothetical protein